MLTGTEDVSKNVQIFKAMEKGTLVPDVSNIMILGEGQRVISILEASESSISHNLIKVIVKISISTVEIAVSKNLIYSEHFRLPYSEHFRRM